MNFEMAAEMAGAEGIEVRSVVVADDVASAPAAEAEQRRGVAGMGFAYKVAGAAAEAGRPLEEVEELARRAALATRSVVIALSPCTVPAAGTPTFEIGDEEMEFGMGIHGEAGLSREPIQPADQVADRMLEAIYDELEVEEGGSVAVLVNGLGATPPEELYIVYRRVHQVLAERGAQVHRALVGEFATSLEMAGVSLSVIKLDEELAGYLDAPAETAFFATGAGIKARL
jgi:dihydroxyacetone kinase